MNDWEQLKKEFINRETEKAYLEIEAQAEPILKRLAKIELSFTEGDKSQVAHRIELLRSAIKDLVIASRDRAHNYAIEKIERFVKDILIDKLLNKIF